MGKTSHLHVYIHIYMYISTYIYIYIYAHAFRRSYFGSNLHVSPYRCASIQGTMTEDGGLFNKKDSSGEPELPLSKKAKTDLYVSPGNALSRKMLEAYGMNELENISVANLWAMGPGADHVPLPRAVFSIQHSLTRN